MKNFFTILMFITACILSNICSADIRSATAPTPTAKVDNATKMKSLQKLYSEIPDINNKEAMAEYIRKRLTIATPANISPDEVNTPSSTSIVDPQEIRNKNTATLSAYEKIYRESMKRAGETDETINQDVKLDGTFYRMVENKQEIKPFVPDFPYVTVKLSNEKEIMAPAEEHFPYVLTSINIEPTGLLRVTEEFIFVSNNESFPDGFFRILPKYNYSRHGKQRRTDISLESVTINGEEHQYKITEIGNYLHIEPQKPLQLPTGIYTYRFKYLIDRAVWFYDEFDELYWDITAKTLKNVVGSANAVVVLPSGKTFLAQNAIVSTRNDLNTKRVTINALSPNSLGFADTEALGVGDDVHLYLTLEKGTLLHPDLKKKYLWFLQDYGAVFFAILALIAIIASYKISHMQIRHNQDKTSIHIKKTPGMFRLLNSNTFDSTSFGAEILNLCTKNILEIKKQKSTAILVKKSDNIAKLSKTEQETVSALFPGQETSLLATTDSQLKIERAYQKLRKDTMSQFRRYKLKLTGSYLLIGIAMMIIGEIGASMVSVNPTHTLIITLTITTILFINMILFFGHYKHKIINWLVKILTASTIICCSGWLSIYTSKLYAVIIILSVWSIINYYQIFARRTGLLRNKIKETEDYKSYLQKNPELSKNSRDFNSKIPYIYAFNLTEKYKDIEDFALIDKFVQLLPKSANKE